MRYICAQPAVKFYTWQVEVMLNNFIKNGINLNKVDIVCYIDNGIVPEDWSKLANNYAARFFFYNDTRETKHYVSSIRPNILKQHFANHPYLSEETIFYHDSDMIFTKPVDHSKYEVDDKWYGSDTRWYIGHDYIISKGEDVLDAMCSIVGIDKNIIKNNELNSIGAQYIMKGIDSTFWENVERDSEQLFKQITELNNQKLAEIPNYHELQIWCADMWAVLWNAWKLGKETVCDKDLDFAWGNSNLKSWEELSIFHNAGVVNATQGFFYKGSYINTLPYKEELEINDQTASYMYWKEIQETGKITVL